jgi:hypothetical protein
MSKNLEDSLPRLLVRQVQTLNDMLVILPIFGSILGLAASYWIGFHQLSRGVLCGYPDKVLRKYQGWLQGCELRHGFEHQ